MLALVSSRVSRRQLCMALASAPALGCRPLSNVVEPSVANYPSPSGERTDELLIVLPGATDTPADLEEHGVIQTLRDAGCDWDILVAYRLAPSYILGDVVADLRGDVVAQGDRTRRVWLALSAGGLVAFDYARVYPDHVDRLVAFAPFLGPDVIIDEIFEAGGLAEWTPEPPIEQIERTWFWLRGYAKDEPRPPLDLYWGMADPFKRTIGLLAEALPEERRHTLPGDHEWPTFIAMFAAFAREYIPNKL